MVKKRVLKKTPIKKKKIELGRIHRFMDGLLSVGLSLPNFIFEGRRSGKREYKRWKKAFNEMSVDRKRELIRLARAEDKVRRIRRPIKRRVRR